MSDSQIILPFVFLSPKLKDIKYVLKNLSSQLQNIEILYVSDNINPQIVFPGPVQELGNRFGSLNETDPCAGQNYCTIKPANYPQELFNKMFKGKFKVSLKNICIYLLI